MNRVAGRDRLHETLEPQHLQARGQGDMASWPRVALVNVGLPVPVHRSGANEDCSVPINEQRSVWRQSGDSGTHAYTSSSGCLSPSIVPKWEEAAILSALCKSSQTARAPLKPGLWPELAIFLSAWDSDHAKSARVHCHLGAGRPDERPPLHCAPCSGFHLEATSLHNERHHLNFPHGRVTDTVCCPRYGSNGMFPNCYNR